jgi:hypothetical protein
MTVVAEPRTSSPPYEAYAAIIGTFVGGLGVARLAASRRRARWRTTR